MTRLIDLGAATFETKQLVLSTIQLDAQKIVENGQRYRAKNEQPATQKVFDPA
jgi:hypothetical protein